MDFDDYDLQTANYLHRKVSSFVFVRVGLFACWSIVFFVCDDNKSLMVRARSRRFSGDFIREKG